MLARPLLAALLLAAPAAAQVTFTGTIEPATLPSICQEETHFLSCTGPDPFSPTGVLLKSSTLDLDPFVGVNAHFTAELRGVECPIYDVTAVAVPPPATLERCGSPTPGCPLRFRVGPTGVIGEYWLFFSTSPDFAPLDPVTGTLLLGPPLVFLGSGPTFGAGAFVEVVIPDSTAVVGLDVWVQGARRDVGPIGPIQLTNVECFTITGPSPPCVVPDC